MSEGQDYNDSSIHENSSTQDNEEFPHEPESIIEEKSGDDFLIELFKQRTFLYDKHNPNFKNTLMKRNAWNEISKTMIETNCGDFYTPDYCQKRCTSLREQYNREKKKMENQSISGNTTSTTNFRRFQFYSQLTFLDKVIKRRRTYSNNVARSLINATLNEKTKICVSNESTSFPSNTEKQYRNYQQKIGDGKLVMLKLLAPKKSRIEENKQLELTSLNNSMNSKIMNMENSKLTAADSAFMEFIKIQFASIPEHEKNKRRKLIMDAISAPLSEI